MAYRPPRKSSGKTPGRSTGRKFHVSKIFPIWGASQTNAVNLAFQALMLKLGVSDTRSYFLKLRIWIVIAVFVCAIGGAFNYGFKGFIFGGLLGLAAPAVLIWVGVLAIGIFCFMAIYVAAWALILWVAWWLLHS